MPRKSIGFETVRKIGLALPGAEEGTAFGMPALKVRGKLFALRKKILLPGAGLAVRRVDRHWMVRDSPPLRLG
jgi:hypothetical protein